ncbi:MAG: tetratricopeptide repeat protein [Oscillatoria sp. SIO1A7]|nr:tetratricopeptide repeat protein [Oscillatoria sp. SIO1A7]
MNADELYSQGLEQYWNGDFEGAVASCDRALAIRPDYLAWNLRKEAIDKLEGKDLEVKPDDLMLWFNRGNFLNKLGRYQEALASFDKALEIKPGMPVLWNNRGAALYDLGRYSEAIASCDKALEIKPHYVAWYNRCIALNELGRYSEAIASLDKALEIKSDYHVAWNNRGYALNELGRYSEAIASLDKALEIKSDYHVAWNSRGYALNELGRYSEAIASYDKALEIKPDDHLAWNNRGYALLNLGRYSEAIASYDKALEIKPDDHLAWNNRGYALNELGRYSEAIASLDKALEIKSDYHVAWNSQGYALNELGRYSEAIASYDKALEFKPDYHLAWNNRGYALNELGRYSEAIASLDKALEIKSDYHVAWNSQGYALNELGRYSEAIASYDKALEFKPDYHLAWNSRGSALFSLGRYSEAIASYDKALEFKPDDHETWNYRGLAFRRLNLYEEAMRDYLKAIELKPDYHKPWRNRGLLLCYFLNRYDEAITCLEEGLQHCPPDTHPEGCGELHQAMGDMHRDWANNNLAMLNPRPYWQKAAEAYEKAIEAFTPERFFRQRLETLQRLYFCYVYLGDPTKGRLCLREGSDLLQRLLAEPNRSDRNKKELRREFARFTQFSVDRLIKHGDLVAALEVAEESKNACLTWLLSGWSDDFLTPSYGQVRELLDPNRAIVYWHLSPAALTTFIIKDGAEEPIAIGIEDAQLRQWETWMADWDKQYADYREDKDKEGEPNSQKEKQEDKRNHPWRLELESKIQRLGEILHIEAILAELQGIGELILIPHRDLHRFPLELLFPDFLLVRLPSAQVGLNLLGSGLGGSGLVADGGSGLVVENPHHHGLPELLHAELESAVIAQMFANPTCIPGEQASKEQLKTALKERHRYFHFTGHGIYEFQNPKLSALALQGKELLTVEDICELDLTGCEIASVSACEIAITGNQTITTEYVGLASALMGVGVANVVSSLWMAESVSSALIMMEFYRLVRKEVPPALALKKAQGWLQNLTYGDLAQWYRLRAAEIRDSDLPWTRERKNAVRDLEDEAEIAEDAAKMEENYCPYNHPYYWAGFTIAALPPR